MDIFLLVTIDFLVLIMLIIVLWINNGRHIDQVKKEILEEIRKV